MINFSISLISAVSSTIMKKHLAPLIYCVIIDLKVTDIDSNNLFHVINIS